MTFLAAPPPFDTPLDLSLADVATRLLAGFAAQLAELDVAVPTRQVIIPGGTTPYDGEQLTIAWQVAHQGQPGHPTGSSMHYQQIDWTAQFEVTLLRETPVLNEDGIPVSADMTACALMLLADAQALRDVALTLRLDEILQEVNVDYVIGPFTNVVDDGGLAGTKFSIAVPWV